MNPTSPTYTHLTRDSASVTARSTARTWLRRLTETAALAAPSAYLLLETAGAKHP